MMQRAGKGSVDQPAPEPQAALPRRFVTAAHHCARRSG